MNPNLNSIPSEEYKPLDNQLSLDDLQSQNYISSNPVTPQPENKKGIKKYLPYVCLVCLICSLFGNINLYYSNTILKKQYEQARSTANINQYWYDVGQKHYMELLERKIELEKEYNFYHDNAVIVTENGSRYHRYGCSHTFGRTYWIYNIENAQYQGYTPCKDCWN